MGTDEGCIRASLRFLDFTFQLFLLNKKYVEIVDVFGLKIRFLVFAGAPAGPPKGTLKAPVGPRAPAGPH